MKLIVAQRKYLSCRTMSKIKA